MVQARTEVAGDGLGYESTVAVARGSLVLDSLGGTDQAL